MFAVFCVARDVVRALHLLDDLHSQGFVDDQISLLFSLGAPGLPRKPSEPTLEDKAEARDLTGILTNLAHGTALPAADFDGVVSFGSVFRPLLEKATSKELQEFHLDFAGIGLSPEATAILQARLRDGKILFALCCRNRDQAGQAEEVLRRAGADDLFKI